MLNRHGTLLCCLRVKCRLLERFGLAYGMEERGCTAGELEQLKIHIPVSF